ncbi:MAG: Inner membrane protein YrbG [Chlamydiae bacterium]|nr:Inner membrane protein YrbG [Chlamydiota bacterium]
MVLWWFLILLGFFLLYLGAELLVRSAIQISHYFKVPRLVIGLTIVAFATSAPEALVGIFGQLKGETGDIALGNVIGSNIANIGMVLGIYLMLRPCDISHSMKWQKIPILLLIYLLLFFVMVGGKISRVEGVYLLLVLIFYNLYQYFFPPKKVELEEEIKVHEEEKRPPVRITLQIFAAIGSMALLILGTQSLLDGALKIAKHFQISERIVSISIIAFGTSLPELATALVSAFRKEQEILIGTIVGSNIFNPLLVIPFATMVGPIYFSPKMLILDFPMMVAFTVLLWILMVLGKNRLSRIDGSILLFSYASYVTFLFYS